MITLNTDSGVDEYIKFFINELLSNLIACKILNASILKEANNSIPFDSKFYLSVTNNQILQYNKQVTYIYINLWYLLFRVIKMEVEATPIC